MIKECVIFICPFYFFTLTCYSECAKREYLSQYDTKARPTGIGLAFFALVAMV